MTAGKLNIRPARAGDRQRWEVLWIGYQAHFGGRVPDAVSAATFNAFLDAQSLLHCLVAERDGELLGFAHVSDTPFAWTAAPVAFLQDLYVSEAARGTGAGKALVAAVYAGAATRGCAKVFWLSDLKDERLARFYRALAHETPFVRFMQKPWAW